jgi:cysteinyl-tRNA synthetase
MNTPEAISRLHSLYGHKELDKVKAGLNLLGINLTKPKIDTTVVEKLIEQRNAMKEMRNWQLADSIREKIIKMGFELQDTPGGTTYKKTYLF